MKKINCILVFVLFVFSLNSFGQRKIFFCNDYTDAAEPINAFSQWSITSTGAIVKILYHNGKENINSSILNLFIDKQDENKKYQHFYSTWAMPDQTKNWSVFEYKFTEAGDYRVKVEDADNNELATENIKIIMKDPDNSSASIGKKVDSGVSVTSSDYKEARIIFSENVDTIKGSALTPTNEFKTMYDEGNKHVKLNKPSNLQLNEFVLVKNGNAFNTNEITMKVYSGTYYNTFLETSKINVNPDKDWFCFKYMFTKTGEYKFELFNQNNIHIATGYVKVTAEKSKHKAYQ